MHHHTSSSTSNLHASHKRGGGCNNNNNSHHHHHHHHHPIGRCPWSHRNKTRPKEDDDDDDDAHERWLALAREDGSSPPLSSCRWWYPPALDKNDNNNNNDNKDKDKDKDSNDNKDKDNTVNKDYDNNTVNKSPHSAYTELVRNPSSSSSSSNTMPIHKRETILVDWSLSHNGSATNDNDNDDNDNDDNDNRPAETSSETASTFSSVDWWGGTDTTTNTNTNTNTTASCASDASSTGAPCQPETVVSLSLLSSSSLSFTDPSSPTRPGTVAAAVAKLNGPPKQWQSFSFSDARRIPSSSSSLLSSSSFSNDHDGNHFRSPEQAHHLGNSQHLVTATLLGAIPWLAHSTPHQSLPPVPHATTLALDDSSSWCAAATPPTSNCTRPRAPSMVTTVTNPPTGSPTPRSGMNPGTVLHHHHPLPPPDNDNDDSPKLSLQDLVAQNLPLWTTDGRLIPARNKPTVPRIKRRDQTKKTKKNVVVVGATTALPTLPITTLPLTRSNRSSSRLERASGSSPPGPVRTDAVSKHCGGKDRRDLRQKTKQTKHQTNETNLLVLSHSAPTRPHPFRHPPRNGRVVVAPTTPTTVTSSITSTWNSDETTPSVSTSLGTCATNNDDNNDNDANARFIRTASSRQRRRGVSATGIYAQCQDEDEEGTNDDSTLVGLQQHHPCSKNPWGRAAKVASQAGVKLSVWSSVASPVSSSSSSSSAAAASKPNGRNNHSAVLQQQQQTSPTPLHLQGHLDSSRSSQVTTTEPMAASRPSNVSKDTKPVLLQAHLQPGPHSLIASRTRTSKKSICSDTPLRRKCRSQTPTRRRSSIATTNPATENRTTMGTNQKKKKKKKRLASPSHRSPPERGGVARSSSASLPEPSGSQLPASPSVGNPPESLFAKKKAVTKLSSYIRPAESRDRRGSIASLPTRTRSHSPAPRRLSSTTASVHSAPKGPTKRAPVLVTPAPLTHTTDSSVLRSHTTGRIRRFSVASPASVSDQQANHPCRKFQARRATISSASPSTKELRQKAVPDAMQPPSLKPVTSQKVVRKFSNRNSLAPAASQPLSLAAQSTTHPVDNRKPLRLPTGGKEAPRRRSSIASCPTVMTETTTRSTRTTRTTVAEAAIVVTTNSRIERRRKSPIRRFSMAALIGGMRDRSKSRSRSPRPRSVVPPKEARQEETQGQLAPNKLPIQTPPDTSCPSEEDCTNRNETKASLPVSAEVTCSNAGQRGFFLRRFSIGKYDGIDKENKKVKTKGRRWSLVSPANREQDDILKGRRSSMNSTTVKAEKSTSTRKTRPSRTLCPADTSSGNGVAASTRRRVNDLATANVRPSTRSIPR